MKRKLITFATIINHSECKMNVRRVSGNWDSRVFDPKKYAFRSF